MPKVPQEGAVTPPKRRGGRVSIRQQEVLEALEMLKKGEGSLVESEDGVKYLCIALDPSKVETVAQAKSALYNLRWKLNPKNPKTAGDAELYEYFFSKEFGRGAVKVEEQSGEILLFVPLSFAAQTITAKKKKEKEPATA